MADLPRPRPITHAALRPSHGTRWARRSGQQHDCVDRRWAHMMAHAAAGADLGHDTWPALVHFDRPRHRALLGADGAERPGPGQAIIRVQARLAHHQAHIPAQHARLTRGDAGRIWAHVARRRGGVDHRRARRAAEAGRGEHNRVVRTRFDARPAARAPGEERRFLDGAWWTMDRERARETAHGWIRSAFSFRRSRRRGPRGAALLASDSSARLAPPPERAAQPVASRDGRLVAHRSRPLRSRRNCTGSDAGR